MNEVQAVVPQPVLEQPIKPSAKGPDQRSVGPWLRLSFGQKFGKINIPPRYKKILIGFLVVLVLLIVLGIFAPYLGKFVKRNGNGGVEATPSPTPIVEENQTTSPYALDPDVLKIEADLKNIDSKYGNMNIREDDLRPPSLDFNVSFGDSSN